MVARALRYCGLLAVTMGSGVLLSFTTPPPSRLAAALRGLVRQPQSTVDAQGVESVAITVVVLLAWLSLAWLCVAVILVMGSAAPGPLGALATVVSAVVVPAAARRLLTTVLGVSLLTGVAASAASAAPIPVSPGQSAAATAVATLDLDWPLAAARPAPTAGPRTPPTATAAPARPLPRASPPVSWPTAGSPAVPPKANKPSGTGPSTGTPRQGAPPTESSRPRLPRSDGAPDGEIVVQRGDTLWAIAARHLGAGATDDEVARAWPRWWAANDAVIGDDPDRILPGQRLTPPPTQH